MAAQNITVNATETGETDGLECKPQSHGNVSVATLRSDLPESRRRNARAWTTQVRVVQDVVELGAELQPHTLADGLPPAHDGIETEGSRVAQIRFGTRAAAERVRPGTDVRVGVEPLGQALLTIWQVAILQAVCIAAIPVRTRESAGRDDRDR